MGLLPGASVRNPTRDKVMQKEAWQNARMWSDFRGSPRNFLSIHPPRPESVCVMLSTYSSVINRGLSPHHLFMGKLELLDNKPPGYNMSVSIQKPLWWLSSQPDRFIWTLTATHVIVYSLPTVRDTGSLKHPRNVGASEESKSFE